VQEVKMVSKQQKFINQYNSTSHLKQQTKESTKQCSRKKGKVRVKKHTRKMPRR
jgi:hypothetical protein